eukprot:Sdes_comp15566_c0_seq1m4536
MVSEETSLMKFNLEADRNFRDNFNEIFSGEFDEEDSEEDSEEDEDFEDFEEKNGPNKNGNQGVEGNLMKKYQPTKNLVTKVLHRIHVEKYEGPNLSSCASKSLIGLDKKTESLRIRRTDKSDRATVEQVLDPRTRMILFKMINQGVFYRVNGCISTGKEANVYHASTEDGKADRAVKIYKTSILVFKDRDRYVSGEFRFRRGYCKSNPRKMVKIWAEKELRNLLRLSKAEIPCPDPILLKNHVLVMSFIGEGNLGRAAPKLKDAEFCDFAETKMAFFQCVHYLREMYHVCRLVHGDFSEYNLLYFRRTVYVIDVSQSVEHDHPNALEFLRKDCLNLVEFFGRRGLRMMRVRQLFEFVTDLNCYQRDSKLAGSFAEKIEDWVGKHAHAMAADFDCLGDFEREMIEREISEQVFMQVFIPRTLEEVPDVEKDVFEGEKKIEAPFLDDFSSLVSLENSENSCSDVYTKKSELYYHKITGLHNDFDDEDASTDEDEEGSKEGWNEGGKSQKDEAEILEEKKRKKEEKKKVKVENREKRKNKIPKHLKKQKIKKTCGKK